MFQNLRSALLEKRTDGDDGGFTLIELLVVIVVLAILAAVVVFALGGITGQSAQAACNADAKSVEVAVTSFYTENNDTYPNLMSDLVGGTHNYLRSAPSNPTHYLILLGPVATGTVTPAASGSTDGTVWVAPEVAAGATGAVVSGGNSYMPDPQDANYDTEGADGCSLVK